MSTTCDRLAGDGSVVVVGGSDFFVSLEHPAKTKTKRTTATRIPRITARAYASVVSVAAEGGFMHFGEQGDRLPERGDRNPENPQGVARSDDRVVAGTASGRGVEKRAEALARTKSAAGFTLPCLSSFS